MGSSVPPIRPDDTATTGLPPRILTPPEYEQAQTMANPSAAAFPVKPPAYAYKPTTPATPRSPYGPSLVPAAESTRVGKEGPTPQGATPFPYEVPSSPDHVQGVLTKMIDPIIHHPFLSAGFAVAQAVPYLDVAVDSYALGSMGSDLAQYGYQKHLAQQMRPDARAEFEQTDQNHVSGEQAVADALMMGMGAAGSVARAARAGSATDAAALAEAMRNPQGIADALGHAPGRTPSEALLPSTAAEAVKAQVADMTRAVQANRAGNAVPFDPSGLSKEEADQAHLGYFLAAQAPGVSPEMQTLAAERANAINAAHDLGHPEVTPKTAVTDASEPPKTEGKVVGSIMPQEPPRPEGPSGLAVASQRVQAHMADVSDAWKAIFAPGTRGPQASEAAGILRSTTGNMAASYEQAAFKLDEFRRAIDPLPDADKMGFIDAIEGGRSQVNPEFQGAADLIRKTLDDTRDAIRALGTGKLEHFIEDYFPHVWEDPDKAADWVKASRPGPGSSLAEKSGASMAPAGGTRPMEGSKSFLKERTIPTTAEGIAAGLKPVSMNPVDLTLLKLREMQRYLMAHQSLAEMKDAGLVKFVAAGAERPDGYTRINDKVATIFGPPEGLVTVPKDAVHAAQGSEVAGPAGAPVTPDEVRVPGMRIMGEYWAPEPVARVVNNYLSPGLRGNALYDAYRGLGNSLNQAQLGLSAFHLGMTSIDAAVSRNALGLEYLASGDFRTAAKKFATSLAAPVPGVVQGTIGDLLNAKLGTHIQWGLGAKIRDAYLNPATASPEMQALANAVKEAGGRIRRDSFYENSAPERFMAAMRAGEYGRAAAASIPAFLEATTKPLMEHVVPLQKLQVFGEMAQKALADLPDDAPLAARRQALQRAWDSVDNRMGQLVYDNLFWNKTFKDLAMASTRSVGWNLGTIRELGGGALDLAAMPKKLASGMSPAEALTHRAAYAVTLPITIGLLGAAYQYLRTGQGPQELKDYFYPKTGEVDADGNAERVQLPNYVKDMIAYAGSPWQTIKHKTAPLPAMVLEMLNNQDYYGDQIRNPDDPAVKQLGQEAAYVARAVTPFSLQGMLENQHRGDQSTATELGNWFGITPAPRTAVRSDAENLMTNYLSHHQTVGATPEDVEARQRRSEILSNLRDASQGKLDPGALERAVTDAIEHQQLTPRQIGQLLKRAGTSPAVEKFQRLTLPEAIAVFKQATPAEQAKFAQALLRKARRAAASESTP